jgi:hypothetical protein
MLRGVAEYLGGWVGEEVMRNLLVGVGGGLWRLFRPTPPVKEVLTEVAGRLVWLPEVETNDVSEGKPMSEPRKFDPSKPVERRDRLPARILCADFRGKSYSIVAAVLHENGEEVVDTYTADGLQDYNDLSGKNDYDLVNVPERVSFWTNLYRNNENTHCWTAGGFATEENARSCANHAGSTQHYVGPIKVDAEV